MTQVKFFRFEVFLIYTHLPICPICNTPPPKKISSHLTGYILRFPHTYIYMCTDVFPHMSYADFRPTSQRIYFASGYTKMARMQVGLDTGMSVSKLPGIRFVEVI